ncbi:adiponectin receptor protein-like [Biomphalaria glabrata]|uniref:Adiponectin receptor protein-like n=1 Tax=Biomphalaria glabrata TaxID=6526 RepID=A0A9W3A2T7_BIOGL|nr:adiponectin receptor protein-like [Biomphalaria glabrata]XP_055881489.1 adiponectin receptor protein-like [Biomphalaria glabrata]XP_055881490.1 adiponectin receptor protein-like [Biomphalaria glabrata]XP_055881491.1 adiponectin receptor protein-like [Biomphalaria glabrata]XP_055881492.1 adiponectin receptor protein-like [Biomphalaria glabrata]KAI8739577.1 adiponectin receptor protein [Biomphalaria glabrata]KAI8771842.1 adiponectin receptor protein [Biomphalaria glabrata]
MTSGYPAGSLGAHGIVYPDTITEDYNQNETTDSLSSYQLSEDLLVEQNVGRSKPNMAYTHEELGSLLTSEEDRLPTDLDEDLDGVDTSLLNVPSKCAQQAEEFVKKVWAAGWNVAHHHTLPDWLKDNDFLLRGHRVPTNSFMACFKSIFRIHTETGNIWTHLLGMIAFLGIAAYFLTRPSVEIQWQEKAVFSAFFMGAILCLGFSWVFHTVYCHSERVGRFFNKLDYCGIALLTIGSFVPWLYYSFYCRLEPKITYLALIFFLGTICIVVSMWDKFAQPHYRPLRAGVFVALGLSGVIPAMHYVITDGFWHAINYAALGWLVLMALLYIVGAVIYAARIPERIFPGKFDIWFQSHQIFHVFVLAAAFVHYHGISEIANYRLTLGDCITREM